VVILKQLFKNTAKRFVAITETNIVREENFISGNNRKFYNITKMFKKLYQTTHVRLDGCIVWNAHNTVFGSKRSAICAVAAYFVQSTRSKIQGLMSRDSIVDRQFVTAWVRE